MIKCKSKKDGYKQQIELSSTEIRSYFIAQLPEFKC